VVQGLGWGSTPPTGVVTPAFIKKKKKKKKKNRSELHEGRVFSEDAQRVCGQAAYAQQALSVFHVGRVLFIPRNHFTNL
jgi:hypothetical protein